MTLSGPSFTILDHKLVLFRAIEYRGTFYDISVDTGREIPIPHSLPAQIQILVDGCIHALQQYYDAAQQPVTLDQLGFTVQKQPVNTYETYVFFQKRPVNIDTSQINWREDDLPRVNWLPQQLVSPFSIHQALAQLHDECSADYRFSGLSSETAAAAIPSPVPSVQAEVIKSQPDRVSSAPILAPIPTRTGLGHQVESQPVRRVLSADRPVSLPPILPRPRSRSQSIPDGTPSPIPPVHGETPKPVVGLAPVMPQSPADSPILPPPALRPRSPSHMSPSPTIAALPLAEQLQPARVVSVTARSPKDRVIEEIFLAWREQQDAIWQEISWEHIRYPKPSLPLPGELNLTPLFKMLRQPANARRIVRAAMNSPKNGYTRAESVAMKNGILEKFDQMFINEFVIQPIRYAIQNS